MLRSRAMLFPIESTDPTAAGPERDESRCLCLDAATNGGAAIDRAAGRNSDARTRERALDILPARSVGRVVTSPPYGSFRDYDAGRFGRDDTVSDYVAIIATDFQKLRCILTDAHEQAAETPEPEPTEAGDEVEVVGAHQADVE